MKITDNFDEMADLGHNYIIEHPKEYSNEYFGFLVERFGPFFENKNDLYSNLYAAIYCQKMYGTNFVEFAAYRFAEKSHNERKQYITWHSHFIYTAFLNNKYESEILNDKYKSYKLLKKYYKRDAMLLSCEDDYDKFSLFVEKHPNIFVKPNNLDLSEGAHRLIYDKNNLRIAFDDLLQEAANISSVEVKRNIDHQLILEELIVPSDFINQLNPSEMSILRVTTINIKGKIHFFYPCLRLLLGDGKQAHGEDFSCVALINPENGEVITNGKNGRVDYDTIPFSGLNIRGIIMPDWQELKSMLLEAISLFPKTRYIGWDLTHTDKGWCIIEGNPDGEFFYQMCVDRGLKEEFEDLIGFKVPYDFWKSKLFQKS